MTIKEKNYWLETVAAPSAQSERELPERVAVVGAGFCGLSAARTLAKRGVNVAVFEAETFGWGASSRNGGMVLTGITNTNGSSAALRTAACVVLILFASPEMLVILVCVNPENSAGLAKTAAPSVAYSVS
jgi:predicted NAD/FAD-binding protein